MHLCLGRVGVSSSALRSLGRSPQLRSFAPLSRGSPPRARFAKRLRGHPASPCRGSVRAAALNPSRDSRWRRASLRETRTRLIAIRAGLTHVPAPTASDARTNCSRAERDFARKRARNDERSTRCWSKRRAQRGRARVKRRSRRRVPDVKQGRREGVLVGALQSEREEETRDPAERGSVVRGSDQVSVAPERTPSRLTAVTISK